MNNQNQRQIEGLEKLSRMLGKEQDGATLFRKLRRLECSLNRLATDYCNGDIDSNRWNAATKYAMKRVKNIFGAEVPGFFVNGDPRGYALKIDDVIERTVLWPKGIYLHRDWGGYALLAPEPEK